MDYILAKNILNYIKDNKEKLNDKELLNDIIYFLEENIKSYVD